MMAFQFNNRKNEAIGCLKR